MSEAYGVAVVAAQATVGHQSITTSDLGGETPVAALFLFSRSTGNGVVDSVASQIHYGATDGTNQWNYTSCNPNGVQTNWPQRGGTDCCVCSLAPDGSIHSKAAVVGFITNGVTIDWSVASADGWILTVLFFAGTDWQAQVGANFFTDTVTLGYQPDAIFLCNNGRYFSDGIVFDNLLRSSFGFVIGPSGPGQIGFCQTGLGGFQGGYNAQCYVAGGFYYNIVQRYFMGVVPNPTGFTLSPTDVDPSNSHTWGWMALKYTGVGTVSGGAFNIASAATGPQSFTGFGGKPGPFALMLEFQRRINLAGTNDAWRMGASISTMTATGGWALGGRGVSPPFGLLTPPYQNFGTTSDNAITLLDINGAINTEGTLQSFDADGLTLNFSIAPALNPLQPFQDSWDWIYFTILDVPAPPPPPRIPVGGYVIERFDNRVWPTVEDCWCVDCGFTLARPTPAATLSVNTPTGAGILTGVTDLIGGDGYSAATTATVVDMNGLGPGSGATAVLTIVAGVITAVSFSPAGTNYVYPALVINDPENLGSGASATITVDNSATFTASAAVFTDPDDVGSVIRAGYGSAVITAVTDSTHVVADIISPLVAIQPDDAVNPNQVITQVSGTWTMTAPISQFYLPQLSGFVITGLADGQIIPPTLVPDDGMVTLTRPASAIIVGLAFQAQLQSTYLDSGEPTIQGQRKKIAEVTVRVEQSAAFQIGGNQPDGSVQSPQQLAPLWQNMVDAPTHAVAPFNSQAIPLFTGDVRIPTPGGFNTRGQVAVQQINPLPLQVLDYAVEVLGGDTPAQKAPERKGRGQQEQ